MNIELHNEWYEAANMSLDDVAKASAAQSPVLALIATICAAKEGEK